MEAEVTAQAAAPARSGRTRCRSPTGPAPRRGQEDHLAGRRRGAVDPYPRALPPRPVVVGPDPVTPCGRCGRSPSCSWCRCWRPAVPRPRPRRPLRSAAGRRHSDGRRRARQWGCDQQSRFAAASAFIAAKNGSPRHRRARPGDRRGVAGRRAGLPRSGPDRRRSWRSRCRSSRTRPGRQADPGRQCRPCRSTACCSVSDNNAADELWDRYARPSAHDDPLARHATA